MKFCEQCSEEIDGGDGENLCAACKAANANGKRRKVRVQKRMRESMLSDLGLVKVRGALGGVYWE